jgi:anti-sigma factor RsiW
MAAAQKSRIEEWFASRAGITVDLPNLTSDGLQLLGGRLTPGITGPAAFVVYEDKAGERFGLLLTRAVGQDTPPTRLIATRTIGAVVWLDGGIARALTGPGEPDRLLRIARLIADASPK